MLRMGICACAVASSAAGQVAVLDFNGLQHGEVLGNQFNSLGVSISAVNPNRSFDIAAVFDTTLMSTADPDLEGPPWNGGNLAADNVVLGNSVIIAENNTDNDNDGLLDDPDDEGSRPAGSITFALDFVATALGFDVVDTEGVVIEGSSVEFFLGGSSVLAISFDEFIDMNSAFFDSSISFGNNSANRIDPIEVAGGFDTFVINAGGSSAYDNFVIVPAPASAALLGLGGLVAIRRR